MSGSFVLRSGVGTQMLTVSSVADDGEVGRGAEAARAHRSCGHLAPRARRECRTRRASIALDLPGVEIDADRLEAASRKLDGQRQADIAEPDDADAGGPRAKLLFERESSA